jgi:hypothetical protein
LRGERPAAGLRGGCVVGAPEPGEQLGQGDVKRLVRLQIQALDDVERGLRAAHLGQRDGLVQGDHRRRGE